MRSRLVSLNFKSLPWPMPGQTPLQPIDHNEFHVKRKHSLKEKPVSRLSPASEMASIRRGVHLSCNLD